MNAAVFKGSRQIEIEDIPRPVPGVGEALVKMRACGVCGGDIPFYDGIPDYITKHPWVLGHEMAGVIAEIGPDTDTTLKRGDAVAIEPLIGCGRCHACRVGRYNCCADLKVIGGHTYGGFAEFCAVPVPVNRCHKVPASMPFDVAAVCEPYSIGANVVKRGQITQDDTVVVNGCGAVGVAVLDFAKNVHGARVLITDMFPSRLARARRLGADVVVNAKEENVLEHVMRFTHNEGASVVVDASGNAQAIESMPRLVAAAGRCVIVGITEHDLKFNGVDIIRKEMTILGSRNSSDIYPGVIDAVTRNAVHPDTFITHRFPFAGIKEAFAFALANRHEIGKVVIEFPE
ncbi:MAG: alcohol dehydrogenase catalytic domain-containing protein [Kiritimatiellae bacterium]|nr:alcohol dehydrogenase catalytic domain-containing protein [Kiritimatiellia bacterium]